MMEPTDLWYAPVPYDVQARRLALDFNLRSADRFFGDRVVPGARRVWFVRELSWAVGALALVSEWSGMGSHALAPTDLAHGIEALASRLAYFAEEERDFARRRLFGLRAFRRDGEKGPWSFELLHRREHYVRNTHRIAITTALRASALGLVVGRRFSSMRPVGFGAELAEKFLSQRVGSGRGTKLSDCLCSWVERGGEKAASIRHRERILDALGPETPSEGERHCVNLALFSDGGESALTRRSLASVLNGYAALPPVEEVIVPALRSQDRLAQALDLVAARSFGAMYDAAISLAFRAHDPIKGDRYPVLISALAQAEPVRMAYDALRERAHAFDLATKKAELSHQPELQHAMSLVQDLKTQPCESVLLTLLKQAPSVFEVHDRTVGRGPLFERITRRLTTSSEEELADEDEDEDEDEERRHTSGTVNGPTHRTFGLDGFLSLINDCRAAEAVR